MKRWIVAVTMGLAFGSVAWAQTVHFNDDNLKEAVKAELGITHDPTEADMLDLRQQLFASFDGITDLTGLEYATNLKDLFLKANQIADISPLAGLTNLEYLELDDNQISAISPLAGLTNLDDLTLQENQISDLSPPGRIDQPWPTSA